MPVLRILVSRPSLLIRARSRTSKAKFRANQVEFRSDRRGSRVRRFCESGSSVEFPEKEA